jgi:curved DNA-binding protein CbpA
MTDPYETLGVDRDATDKEVKRAYRTLIQRYHPDKFDRFGKAAVKRAKEETQEITSAYEQIDESRKSSTPKQSGLGATKRRPPASFIGLLLRFKKMAQGYSDYKASCTNMRQSINRAQQVLREQYTDASEGFAQKPPYSEHRHKANEVLQRLVIEVENTREFSELERHITAIFQDVKATEQRGTRLDTNINFKHLNPVFLSTAEAAYEALIPQRSAAIENGLDVISGRTGTFTYTF